MEGLFKQLLPIIGVIIGACIQFVFSRFTERNREKQNLKIQAYTSYLKAIANLAMAQKFNLEDKIASSTSELVEAKIKIAIYGSNLVINGLANFERGDANLDSDNQKKIFIEVGKNMRKDAITSKEVVDNKDFSQLIFSTDLNFND